MRKSIFIIASLLLSVSAANAQGTSAELGDGNVATGVVAPTQGVSSESGKEQVLTKEAAGSQDVYSETAKSLIPTVKAGNDIKLKIGGFFRAEYYVDSREIVGACDDLFGFFPEDKVYDSNGKDLNGVVRQNISTQATRLTTTFEGPKLGKADSKAYIEFDFSGGNSVNVRLRQAWAKLTWQ